jgi:phosphopantetheinyl transferase
MPLVGDVVQLVPQKEIVTQRMLDLEEDLFLRDHVLIDEGSGKPVEHRLPILPMTMILEAAAETAACLAPGLGLIGFERITAHRWIDFRDSRTLQLTVTARLDTVDPETGVHRIAAEVASNGRPSASATVLFADAYREDVQLRFTEFQNPRSWPLTAEEIYTERYMFHGPRFRCVTGLNVLGEQGLWGEITVQPKQELFASAPDPQLLVDPVVLDGVAQLVAMFAIVNGVFLMPAKITKLEFYGPTPPPGTRVPVRIEVRNMSTTQRTVTADAEVQDGNGGVWFRFEGINEWLYEYPPQLQDTQRLPGRFHLATETPLPAVGPGTICTLLRRADLRHANIEWLARLFLDQAEWTYFDGLKLLPRQWQWLMGRIAVKDAVRLHLARQMGTEMIHPALISIAADEAGRPYVVPLEGCPPMPEISIAHTEGWAAALAAEAGCGIDIEPVARDVSAVLPRFATAEELGLIRSIEVAQGEASWPLRLWCAKEALGKALGTGLGGRPTDFQAIDIEPDGRVLVYHRPSGNTYSVSAAQNDVLLLAYASLADVGVEVSTEEPADSNYDSVPVHSPR